MKLNFGGVYFRCWVLEPKYVTVSFAAIWSTMPVNFVVISGTSKFAIQMENE